MIKLKKRNVRLRIASRTRIFVRVHVLRITLDAMFVLY